ncbi:Hypp6133 [Branchiostoma lanceolatum]|uniref:Hypp6133 protein n=1 Tax=Branchiostoma lanceolatum TaxID=7740 RepID=A0A8J9YNQ4_BRALA|nr:Hypp6133 [Branchiostoma lanceolatum]
MHLLEDHVVPCIRKWAFGLGFLAEQGIEETHAQFNLLSQSTRSIANPVERLKSTLKDLIKVSPDHMGTIPEPVKRKIM